MVWAKFGFNKNYRKSQVFGILPPQNRNVPPTLQYFNMVQPYAVMEISLTNARTVAPIGNITLSDGTSLPAWAANSFTITNFPAGAAASFGFGDPLTTPTSAGMVTGSSGYKFDNVPFTQLYVSNAAQSGVTVEVQLSWIDP